MEDNRILDMFNKRDEQALRSVEKKYGRLCFSIANNILKNTQDAQECVNDTYLAAWNAIPPAQPQKLSAYLAKIARNKALSLYEKRSRRQRNEELCELLSELGGEASGADISLNEHIVSDIINDYLRDVPKNKATIFIGRYFMCCSIDEIADITGYSYNRVSVTLHRMRAELRKKLREEGVEI